MADDTETQPTTPVTLRNAVFSMNPRITLAFFLVSIAAFLIIWLGSILNDEGVEAGTAALLAGLVTLIVKMADNSVNYQYQSSAGSDKKDTAQAAVTQELAKKVTGTGNGSDAAAAAARAAPAAAALAAPAAAAQAAPPAAEVAAPPIVAAEVAEVVPGEIAKAMAAQAAQAAQAAHDEKEKQK